MVEGLAEQRSRCLAQGSQNKRFCVIGFCDAWKDVEGCISIILPGSSRASRGGSFRRTTQQMHAPSLPSLASDPFPVLSHSLPYPTIPTLQPRSLRFCGAQARPTRKRQEKLWILQTCASVSPLLFLGALPFCRRGVAWPSFINGMFCRSHNFIVDQIVWESAPSQINIRGLNPLVRFRDFSFLFTFSLSLSRATSFSLSFSFPFRTATTRVVPLLLLLGAGAVLTAL